MIFFFASPPYFLASLASCSRSMSIADFGACAGTMRSAAVNDGFCNPAFLNATATSAPPYADCGGPCRCASNYLTLLERIAREGQAHAYDLLCRIHAPEHPALPPQQCCPKTVHNAPLQKCPRV